MTIRESDNSLAAREEAAERQEESLSDSSGAIKPGAHRRQLGLLGFVLACAAGVGFWSLKSGPQAASGSIPQAPAAGEIGGFLTEDSAAAGRIQQTLAGASRLTDEFRFRPGMTQVPVTDLKANPFRSQDGFAPPVAIPADSTERREDEQERQAALCAVQSLQLQSVLRGDSHRACLINNMLYQEGQTVDGFVIEEIGLNTVVVRQGVYRFELKGVGAK